MSKKIKKFLKNKHGHGKKIKNIPGPPKVSSQEGTLQHALSLHRSGLLSQAESLYRQILAIEPNHPDALHYLGMLAQQAGKSGIAVELISKALNCQPDYVDAHNNLGDVLMSQGKLDEAVAHFRMALSLKPDYPEVLYNLGNALKVQGHLGDAIAVFRQALSLKPYLADAYNNLGDALKAQGHLDEAAASFRKVLILQPGFAEAHYNLGNALLDMGKLDEAAASYRQALAVKPDHVKARYNLGSVLVDMGKLDEAAACFRRVLSLRPDHSKSYRLLSLIEDHTEYDLAIKAKEDLYNEKILSNEEKIHLGFALGKVFEDLKQYDKSFRFIAEANQLQRGLYEYSLQADHDLFGRIEDIFSPEFFSSHQGTGNPDETPVFIIGMPRSGTTLIEQILSSHPLVFGAGELEDLTNLTNSFCPGGPAGAFPECLPHLDAASFEKMGSDYIAGIRCHSKDDKYITDKMPHNFFYVGLIKVILPNARIIHCRRDPMDNCLSIFKNYFKGLHKYAHDLNELGRYYQLYRVLMEHWERVLPGFMYSLKYEDMVFDQEGQTAKLLEFCSLPWDDACLSFHKTKRIVQTASFSQVRQPIYNDSIKLWKRYESQLEPLRKALYG